ncbi:MAG: hypothetical protein WA985_07000 [Erythrobacter sp.]
MLIREVEQFLRRNDMPATKFGRLAAHDPRFVLDLRMGRIPRPATEARTREWMRQFERNAFAPCKMPGGTRTETKGLLYA